MEPKDPRIEHVNRYLNNLSLEELRRRSEEQAEQDERDFQELKSTLARGRCYYCSHPLTHFSDRMPCFHWLLKPKGFKKRHFPLLYEIKSFHQIQAYLRWVANSAVPIQNINDLVDERSSSKIIEETIRYKNLEWSFSCGKGCFKGIEHSRSGNFPHYHFQMKVDGLVVINYGGFHIPFHDYDFFCFTIGRGEFDRLKAAHVHGAGMQTLYDHMTPEELVDSMRRAENEDEAQFHVSTMITADEGTTISGEDIAELMEERKRTGESMAKLVRKLKNVSVQSVITPGPGVPEIAARRKSRGNRKTEDRSI
jgi:hypothetical protein